MKSYREILEATGTSQHNNPYVGRLWDDPILYFKAGDKLFVWIGQKWLESWKAKDISKYRYAQKDAALELIRKAVPKLKKQTNMGQYLKYMRGWE
jgi:hypothetical protein